MKIQELAKARLLHAVLRREHPQVRDRERRGSFFIVRDQLAREPARREEVEHPAELGAAGIQRFMRARIFFENPAPAACTGFTLMRTPRTPSPCICASSTSRMSSSTSTMPRQRCGADFAHRVEHAAVVAAVGARLHEHVALDPELRRQAVVVERREWWLVAQVRSIGVLPFRPEYMEMTIAERQSAASFPIRRPGSRRAAACPAKPRRPAPRPPSSCAPACRACRRRRAASR